MPPLGLSPCWARLVVAWGTGLGETGGGIENDMEELGDLKGRNKGQGRWLCLAGVISGVEGCGEFFGENGEVIE